MELRHRPRTQHGRWRALHPAGEHRCNDGGRGVRAGQVQGAALHAASGWTRDAGVRGPSCRLHAGARPMNAAVLEPVVGAATVDECNPWLGLASFTEETRQYFFGRDEEVAELARRVQRKLLTVLFGQSGLGKTSILRAGLVPRLRAQGYCPIY